MIIDNNYGTQLALRGVLVDAFVYDTEKVWKHLIDEFA